MRPPVLASALVIVALLTSCASPDSEAADSAATPTPTPSQTKDAPTTNEHGHLPKALGEIGAVLFPGTDDPAISFKVTGVNLAPECDSLYYVPPQNGSYIVIEVEFTTAESYLQVMPGMVPLRWFWYDFTSYGADGSSTPNTANSVTCLSQEAIGPMDLPTGAVTVMRYAIDVPPGTTSVAVVPEMFGKVPGWEWPLS